MIAYVRQACSSLAVIRKQRNPRRGIKIGLRQRMQDLSSGIKDGLRQVPRSGIKDGLRKRMRYLPGPRSETADGQDVVCILEALGKAQGLQKLAGRAFSWELHIAHKIS